MSRSAADNLMLTFKTPPDMLRAKVHAEEEIKYINPATSHPQHA